MKFFPGKYRVISIWLSLMILTLAFIIGSEKAGREICVFLVFLLGGLLYSLGGVQKWMVNRMTACLVEALLAVCMMVAAFLTLLRIGGIV